MKRKKQLLALAVLMILAVLTCACSLREEQTPPETAPVEEQPLPAESSAPGDATEETPAEEPPPEQAAEAASSVPTEEVPDEAPAPAEPEEKAASTCTVSISCAALLEHLDQLEAGVRELVPGDGVLLAPTAVELKEGDRVFDLLQRACREAGIHMEYQDTPGYGSAYVEGIGNLYEFDGGALSGWMYRVNGTFPNKGCSAVAAAPGDQVEWVYTCDLGRDVGGGDSGQLGA